MFQEILHTMKSMNMLEKPDSARTEEVTLKEVVAAELLALCRKNGFVAPLYANQWCRAVHCYIGTS